MIEFDVSEDGVPLRWRIMTTSGQRWAAGDVSLMTERPDRSRQTFAFTACGAYLESVDEIAEPHEFVAHEAGARLVLVGDVARLGSVEAGRAFGQLQELA